jgi:His/Glu/Gln/Arg/opine family amino acid ABC transporter permease subunit
MEAFVINTDLILNSLPALVHGALLSLQIAFCAALIGLTWGTVLGIVDSGTCKPLKRVVGAYVTLFRGTPMLVQILFVYYVLPEFGVEIDPMWAAVLAIGLNSSAYISQTVRSGISAVSYGQVEAALAMGFGKVATMRYIVLPQAFRVVLPTLGNEMVTLVKDSSLASIIGVMELSKEGSLIRSRTYDAFSILLAVSFIYLSMTAAVSYGIKKIEHFWKVDVYS